MTSVAVWQVSSLNFVVNAIKRAEPLTANLCFLYVVLLLTKLLLLV
jgi:hypothetical protein